MIYLILYPGLGSYEGVLGWTQASEYQEELDEAAEKYDHKGDGERDGSQKIGNLVKRHIDLSIKDGNVVKNDDGTYSRAV